MIHAKKLPANASVQTAFDSGSEFVDDNVCRDAFGVSGTRSRRGCWASRTGWRSLAIFAISMTVPVRLPRCSCIHNGSLPSTPRIW